MFLRYPTNSIDLDPHVSYHSNFYLTLALCPSPHFYNPKGLLALPFLTAPPVKPGLEAILAAPPAAPVDRPSGFPFVVARLPAAPVISLIELPYSLTISPQPLDVFDILCIVSLRQADLSGLVKTYLAPAPFPAPATPFPAAVTTAPAAFPMPDAAALVTLLIPELAAPMVLVSQLLFCGAWTFLGVGGTAFFAPTGCEPTGFLTAGAPTFFAAVVGGGAFFVPMGVGFLYGTVLVWAAPTEGFFAGPTALGPMGLGRATAFLVPMGWATMMVVQLVLGGFKWDCRNSIGFLEAGLDCVNGSPLPSSMQLPHIKFHGDQRCPMTYRTVHNA